MSNDFPSFYFETLFAVDRDNIPWPPEFAIITAYATTGTSRCDHANEAANDELLREIRELGIWHESVTGFSPTTGHSEPGWAVELPLDQCLALGAKHQQHAIYFIQGDQLNVCLCLKTGSACSVGLFRERIRRTGQ